MDTVYMSIHVHVMRSSSTWRIRERGSLADAFGGTLQKELGGGGRSRKSRKGRRCSRCSRGVASTISARESRHCLYATCGYT
jgi:hypothetical protein